jgi:hypothetical protein
LGVIWGWKFGDVEGRMRIFWGFMNCPICYRQRMEYFGVWRICWYIKVLWIVQSVTGKKTLKQK